ncbi:MAG: dihydrolipoyl dehydrogenase [Pseudomonadota bacterium]
MSDPFDLIVIGAGPGGHALAEHAARHGARTAIIEKNLWGGTCTHRGCIPTKALLACSKHYADLRKMKRLGIAVDRPSFDFTAMKRHQQQMVRISALGVEKSLRDAGVTLQAGEGKILSPREIQWTDADGNVEILQSEHIAIAWGSEPALLPDMAISGHIMDSDGFLQLQALPEDMIIVGGSVIGVEFATFLAELGVKVMLIELLEQILPLEDEDTSILLNRELTRLGVAIHVSTRVQAIRETADGVQVAVVRQGKEFELTAAGALICSGRKPCLDRGTLNRLGIRHDRTGIRVDAQQMTNIPGIYAIGDVTGGIMLAHRAIQQGKALASALFGDGSIVCHEASIPAVVYSHPQVARVGLTEMQAGRQGLTIEVMKSDYAANIIARTELMGPGFVKMLFQRDKLIGATIVGDAAADLIASMSFAVANGLGTRELSRWIIPHPTLSEVFIRH